MSIHHGGKVVLLVERSHQKIPVSVQKAKQEKL